MLCDHCQKHEAIIHRIVIINGEKREQHLCAECAQRAGTIVFKLPTFAQLTTKDTPKDEGKTCVCGITFSDFCETGMLGCAQCYQTFESELAPIVTRAQSGRTQQKNRNMPLSVDVEIAELQSELDAAVKREEYEQAAILRDRIRELMAKGDAKA